MRTVIRAFQAERTFWQNQMEAMQAPLYVPTRAEAPTAKLDVHVPLKIQVFPNGILDPARSGVCLRDQGNRSHVLTRAKCTCSGSGVARSTVSTQRPGHGDAIVRCNRCHAHVLSPSS